MLNLENLKKQAKALVRLHRERSHHLADIARELLPKYAGMSDSQVLAAAFKLADAQALLARQHGCASWDALKAKAAAAEPEPDPAAVFGSGVICAVPMLYVADVRRSIAYYGGPLGFDVVQVAGDPPFFAEVWRGGAKLALRYVHGGKALLPEVKAREPMFLQAMVRVGDIKALYLELLAAGVTFQAPLQRDAYGPQYFIVEDPDGNLISFGEPGPRAVQREAGRQA